MTTHTVGTYYCICHNQQQAAESRKYADRIGDVVARQCEIRGADKVFKFRAFGFDWIYKPDDVPQEVKVDPHAL